VFPIPRAPRHETCLPPPPPPPPPPPSESETNIPLPPFLFRRQVPEGSQAYNIKSSDDILRLHCKNPQGATAKFQNERRRMRLDPPGRKPNPIRGSSWRLPPHAPAACRQPGCRPPPPPPPPPQDVDDLYAGRLDAPSFPRFLPRARVGVASFCCSESVHTAPQTGSLQARSWRRTELRVCADPNLFFPSSEREGQVFYEKQAHARRRQPIVGEDLKLGCPGAASGVCFFCLFSRPQWSRVVSSGCRNDSCAADSELLRPSSCAWGVHGDGSPGGADDVVHSTTAVPPIHSIADDGLSSLRKARIFTFARPRTIPPQVGTRIGIIGRYEQDK